MTVPLLDPENVRRALAAAPTAPTRAAPPTRKPPKRGSHRVIVHNLEHKLSRLAMPLAEVARLRASQRETRLDALIAESFYLFEWGLEAYVTGRPGTPARDRREVAGIVGLFSGGNDSTTFMHLFRDRLTHAGLANTQIGVEETRQYVRDTCAAWGLPLLERTAPREVDSYWSYVRQHGYPGPGAHERVYQRIKLRAFEQMQRELVENGFRQRIVFVAGRRRTESARRSLVPSDERIRSAVWLTPLVNWTKLDLMTYRKRHPEVPRNEVADRLHMSAECLCGCYAHHGERAEITAHYPRAFDKVAETDAWLAEHRPDLPEWRRTWGFAGDPELLKRSKSKPSKATGRVSSLCEGSCDVRHAESLPHAAHSLPVALPA